MGWRKLNRKACRASRGFLQQRQHQLSELAPTEALVETRLISEAFECASFGRCVLKKFGQRDPEGTKMICDVLERELDAYANVAHTNQFQDLVDGLRERFDPPWSQFYPPLHCLLWQCLLIGLFLQIGWTWFFVSLGITLCFLGNRFREWVHAADAAHQEYWIMSYMWMELENLCRSKLSCLQIHHALQEKLRFRAYLLPRWFACPWAPIDIQHLEDENQEIPCDEPPEHSSPRFARHDNEPEEEEEEQVYVA